MHFNDLLKIEFKSVGVKIFIKNNNLFFVTFYKSKKNRINRINKKLKNHFSFLNLSVKKTLPLKILELVRNIEFHYEPYLVL
jgi:hypothetical protein